MKYQINENRLYRDIENGEIINELELYMCYLDTEQNVSFPQYINNCLNKNGFLEIVKGT